MSGDFCRGAFRTLYFLGLTHPRPWIHREFWRVRTSAHSLFGAPVLSWHDSTHKCIEHRYRETRIPVTWAPDHTFGNQLTPSGAQGGHRTPESLGNTKPDPTARAGTGSISNDVLPCLVRAQSLEHRIIESTTTETVVPH